ncbi:hypothetical protein [Halioxenophilus sp. WMMB6]|uniref:hypothetical protein n=1 Tax=Halioxenophilus sp. WMMB6 TaxID=3073815 RepID=UPI00295E80F3|nr:hypothetical protein [Halioxenophilus sp. WMMB6]
MITPLQLQPGQGLCRQDGLPGSLGLAVRDRHSDRIGLLSCWHVLATPQGREGDLIHRHSAHPYPVRREPIATLARWFLDDEGDAAVAWLLPGVTIATELSELPLILTNHRAPQVGDILVKVGAQTGCTRARVTNIGHHPASYGHTQLTMAGFYLEPISQPKQCALISAPGDSGAIWCDELSGAAVGLHVGGECRPHFGPIHAKACTINRVLQRLEVDLL